MVNLNFYERYFDQYNIYNLITKINPNYRLFFDKKNKKFVIFNVRNNFEECLRFDSFNFDILGNLQKYDIKNARDIFRKIDEQNAMLEQKQSEKCSDEMKCQIKDLSHYLSRTNHVSKSDIEKIVEVKNG